MHFPMLGIKNKYPMLGIKNKYSMLGIKNKCPRYFSSRIEIEDKLRNILGDEQTKKVVESVKRVHGRYGGEVGELVSKLVEVEKSESGIVDSRLTKEISRPRYKLRKTIRIKVATDLFNSFASYPDDSEEACITLDNLKTMLTSMGNKVNADTLGIMLAKADVNGDGIISLTEFLNSYEWLVQRGMCEEDYRSLFNLLDVFKKGYLELSDLVGVVGTSKHHITINEAKDFMSAANLKGDGMLRYREFRDFLQTNQIMGWKLMTAFRVLFVMGGPGSGKGTICKEVMKRTGCVHVSCGDLLRTEIEEQTPLGKEVEGIISRGELVSASVVIVLLEKYLATQSGRIVLLDGFPRSRENTVRFTELFGPADGVLIFDCPDHVMMERIVKRGKTSGRSDDNENTAKKRITTFHTFSAGPLLYFEREASIPIFSIDSTKHIEQNVNYICNLPIFKTGKF